MSKDKSGSNSKPVKPSKSGSVGDSRTLGESTNTSNKGTGALSKTTTGSTGPKSPTNKK